VALADLHEAQCRLDQFAARLRERPDDDLDDDAAGFVAAHLTSLPGVVVLASHDRVFLDEVCTGILDLDPTRDRPRSYGGSYSDYLRAKQTELRRWEEQYAAEQEQLAALRRAVATTARKVSPHRPPRDGDKVAYQFHRGRVQAQVSRRVRNAQRRLVELRRQQTQKPPTPLRFWPLTRTRAGRPSTSWTSRQIRTRRATDGWSGSGGPVGLIVTSREPDPPAAAASRRNRLLASMQTPAREVCRDRTPL
jgi:macrolide transport system ATP-binding/permease protein